jgi:hypothetical protein
MGIPLSPRTNRSSIRLRAILIGILIIVLLVGVYLAYRFLGRSPERMIRLRQFLGDPEAHPDWAVVAGERCGDAPFVMPTDGLIGFLWGDSFRLGHSHQGLDIFGGPILGVVPVVAAYDGYLTRNSNWRSAVIIRHPEDPLSPGRQIWTYYSHMADPEGNSYIVPQFPPGTTDAFVEAGTMLGYQGNYSGDAANPAGIHLHFSIVLDDGYGHYRNELEIRNTLDPLPYLGINSDMLQQAGQIAVCPD